MKCDKQKPCSNCLKARAECVIAPPSGPRRRRRKLAPEVDLVAKLRRYERLLKDHGVNIESEEKKVVLTTDIGMQQEDVDVSDVRRLTMGAPRPDHVSKGALFFDKDSSHYVEK